MNIHLGQASTGQASVPLAAIPAPTPTPGPLSAGVLSQVLADTAFWNTFQSAAVANMSATQASTLVGMIQQEITAGASSTLVNNILISCPTAGASIAAFEAALMSAFVAPTSGGACGTPASTSASTSAPAAGDSTLFGMSPMTLLLIAAGVVVFVMVEKH